MLFYKRLFLLIVLPLITTQGFSQDTIAPFDITVKSVKYPHYFPEWKIKTSLGFSMVTPPRDLVENALQAPLVVFHAVMGMPYHLSVDGEISTIIVSNQITLGPKYNVMIKKFSANAGIDISYAFGFLNSGGFDNSAQLWSYYPNMSVAYRLGNVNLTLRGDISMIIQGSSKSGENEVISRRNFFNGGSLGIYVEQRLWKNKVFIAGFRDNYLKFYWPTWMLFSTFDRYYHIPELSFSWTL